MKLTKRIIGRILGKSHYSKTLIFVPKNKKIKNQFWPNFTFRQFWIFAPKLENIFEYFIPKKVSNDLIFVPKNLDFDVFDPKLNLQKIEKSQKIRNSGFFFCLKSSVKVDSKLTQFVKLQYTPKIPWVEKQIIHLSKRKWSSDHFDKIFCSIEFLGT